MKRIFLVRPRLDEAWKLGFTTTNSNDLLLLPDVNDPPTYDKSGDPKTLLIALLEYSGVSWLYVETTTAELLGRGRKWRRGASCLPSSELSTGDISATSKLILTEDDVMAEDHGKQCLVHSNPAPYSDFVAVHSFVFPEERPVILIMQLFQHLKPKHANEALNSIQNSFIANVEAPFLRDAPAPIDVLVDAASKDYNMLGVLVTQLGTVGVSEYTVDYDMIAFRHAFLLKLDGNEWWRYDNDGSSDPSLFDMASADATKWLKHWDVSVVLAYNPSEETMEAFENADDKPNMLTVYSIRLDDTGLWRKVNEFKGQPDFVADILLLMKSDTRFEEWATLHPPVLSIDRKLLARHEEYRMYLLKHRRPIHVVDLYADKTQLMIDMCNFYDMQQDTRRTQDLEDWKPLNGPISMYLEILLHRPIHKVDGWQQSIALLWFHGKITKLKETYEYETLKEIFEALVRLEPQKQQRATEFRNYLRAQGSIRLYQLRNFMGGSK